MKLTIVGTGYVGLVTGVCFAETGHDVTCIDIDADRVSMLREGTLPFHEPRAGDMLQSMIAQGRLHFGTDLAGAIVESEVIFLCLPTENSADGMPELDVIEDVAARIADAVDALERTTPAKTIVIKSTVPMGTTAHIRDLVRSRTDHRLHVACNPEFLREGSAVSDCLLPDRIVCGVDSDDAERVLRTLYEPHMKPGHPLFLLDSRSAEMVKYASNAMLASRISFINEIAGLCERYGADIHAVREAMCADERIGTHFLEPGIGYGGSCFPKDIVALARMGKDAGMECPLAEAVDMVNRAQLPRFWNRIQEYFGGGVAGRTLAFWGASFKPDTDDLRNAPGITLMRMAQAEGARVRAWDPVALDALCAAEPTIEAGTDMYEVLEGCDALVICTQWNAFLAPDFPRVASALLHPVIFDGRNLYPPDRMLGLGFDYLSVGRPPVHAASPVLPDTPP